MSERSAEQRFGGERYWSFPDGTKLNVGETITGAGPGEGVAILPWALDTYERALRLKRDDTWLLKRMLRHAWTPDTVVFVSIHKITREADITRNGVKNILARLENLGYIVRLDPAESDQRRRYSVKPFYEALALCIACDPTSKWARAHGPLPNSLALGMVGSNGRALDPDLSALPRRNGHVKGVSQLARTRADVRTDSEQSKVGTGLVSEHTPVSERTGRSWHDPPRVIPCPPSYGGHGAPPINKGKSTKRQNIGRFSSSARR